MYKYSYPAVFTPLANGFFSIYFPDLENCRTCGNSLAESIMNAEDVLAYTLYDYEISDKLMPAPSSPGDISLHNGEFVNYIACDTLSYRKRFVNTAVRKTVSLPSWLNEEASARGLNFSQVLQEALIEKINSCKKS